jgi:hypothetical protein
MQMDEDMPDLPPDSGLVVAVRHTLKGIQSRFGILSQK